MNENHVIQDSRIVSKKTFAPEQREERSYEPDQPARDHYNDDSTQESDVTQSGNRITPQGIIGDAEDIMNRLNGSEFPIDVFPSKMRDIIWKMKKALTYPVDYTASSMLVAVALGIGNTHVLRFKEEWSIKCILFLALVGNPGTNKSHPLRSVFRPFFDFDKRMFRKYKEELGRYNKVMSFDRKERKEHGYATDLSRPVRRRFLVSDITQEAMAKVLDENKRGICLYMDELHAWVKNFTRYNKSSEEEFYLSLFNGDDCMSDRREDEKNVSADEPFTCVTGTIQPGVLQSMFRGVKNANGFVERILFAFPGEQRKEYWNDDGINYSFSEDWKAILQSLIGMNVERDGNGMVIPTVMEYSPEARKEVMSWQHAWADMINAEDDEKIKGIYCKFEFYIHRFSMVIQVCKWLCDGESHVTIDADTVGKAAKLIDYFKETALHVLSVLDGGNLGVKQQLLLENLPKRFTRAEGKELATRLGMSSRTYDRFLKNGVGTYFRHGYGKYTKIG